MNLNPVPCEPNVQASDALTATRDIVLRDRHTPGLGVLLDTDRLLDCLRTELDTSNINAIKLDYLRYKPGMNCIARYQLDVAGQKLLAYGKAFSSEAAGKLHKHKLNHVTDGLLGKGRVVLQDQLLVFSTFPNDSRLPGLRSIDDSIFRASFFGRLFGEDRAWQDGNIDGVINYKPERRFVSRLKRPDGESALLKFYSRSGFAAARAISRRLCKSHQDFYPVTLGRSKKYCTVAFNWQAGVTLRQKATQGEFLLDDLVAAIESLATFHASANDGLVSISADQQAISLYALAGQLGILLPQLEQRAKKVAETLADWLATDATAAMPIHGDFYDKQVLVNDNETRLIDFDAARLGNPLEDIGNYIAHLHKRRLGGVMTESELVDQIEVLLSSYRKSRSGFNSRQLDPYIALGLFKLIHQPFRDWQLEWPQQTELILTKLESLLTQDISPDYS